MTILSEYDRTHVVSAVASYDFGHDWSAGLRVFAYSGRPYTPVAGTEWVEPYDSARLPGFYRIDARLEKSWRLGERDRIALVVEGINVTLNKEVVSATCGGGPTASTMDGALPGVVTLAQTIPINAWHAGRRRADHHSQHRRAGDVPVRPRTGARAEAAALRRAWTLEWAGCSDVAGKRSDRGGARRGVDTPDPCTLLQDPAARFAGVTQW